MNEAERMEIGLNSTEWLIKEVEQLIEKYKAASPKEQAKLMPQLNYMFGRLTFEKKELAKVIGD